MSNFWSVQNYSLLLLGFRKPTLKTINFSPPSFYINLPSIHSCILFETFTFLTQINPSLLLPLRTQCCLYFSLTSSSSVYFSTSRALSFSRRGFMSRFCSARLRLAARAISLSSWMFWICRRRKTVTHDKSYNATGIMKSTRTIHPLQDWQDWEVYLTMAVVQSSFLYQVIVRLPR